MSKNICITGASSDIGLSIVEKLIETADFLLLQGNRNSEKLKTLKQNNPEKISILNCDFSDNVQLNEFLVKLKNTDILINVAAFTKADLLVNLSDDDIQKMLQVNIFALTKLCQAVIPMMLVKRNGIIVNISSIAASKGNRGQSVYAGTKGFMESFSKSLAAEYGSKGIRVNCVAPGAIDAGSIKELIAMASDEVKKNIASNRFGKPEDVANAVNFLCTNEANFINGQVIHVDGGFMKGI